MQIYKMVTIGYYGRVGSYLFSFNVSRFQIVLKVIEMK